MKNKNYQVFHLNEKGAYEIKKNIPEKNRPRVGIDFDGVLTYNVDEHKRQFFLNKGIVIPVTKRICLQSLIECNSNVSQEIIRKLYDECLKYLYIENILNIDPWPNVFFILQQLKNTGYDIFIVTSRKVYKGEIDALIAWLKKHNYQFYIDGILSVNTGSKNVAIQDLDPIVYVDDSEKVLSTINHPTAKLLLMDERGYSKSHSKYDIIRNWSTFHSFLIKVMRESDRINCLTYSHGDQVSTSPKELSQKISESSTFNGEVIYSDHHTVHINRQSGLVFKSYKSWEADRAYKNFLVSRFVDHKLVVNAFAVYEMVNTDVILVSEYESGDIYEVNIHSLTDFNYIISRFHELQQQLLQIPITSDGFVSNSALLKWNIPQKINFEKIDYKAEFLRRAFMPTDYDQNGRFQRFSIEVQEQLKQIYQTRKTLGRIGFIHGDAKCGNIIGKRFIDFDHLRLGESEYDIGRFLVRSKAGISVLSHVINSISNLYDKEAIMFYLLHHGLTVMAENMATNRNERVLIFAKCSQNALLLLGKEQLAHRFYDEAVKFF